MTLPRTRRVALITNLCPHYRRPLFETLAQRYQLECFFFAESEPYWNPLLPLVETGEFTRVQLRRVHLFGEPLLPGLAGRLTSDRYDAVIMSLTGRLMIPYVYAVARARGLPFVLWTGLWHHPTTRFHGVTRGIAEALYRHSDAIVVYGEHVRRSLVAVSRVDDAKIFTAGQAVEGGKFDVGADPARSHELLFVGRFEPQKGIGDLLAAFSAVKDERARLAFVGNGSLDADLRRRAALDPRIDVVGHVPQEELPERLARARALVLPSITTEDFREPWGLVANEAMHAGLPVIATDAVGAAAHGLVADGATGFVVPERDRAALGAAMARIVEDDELAARLGREARVRVAGYTFDRMADAFEAAVEYGIGERRDTGG